MLKKEKTINAIKISIAALSAITIASLLQLDFTISAGIVAILSVASTKKETVVTAFNRFLAFCVAIMIAYLCYEWLGYDELGFFLYLILFLMICQHMGWISAMAVDSVLISHFIGVDSMNLLNIGNEFLLFLLGVSCAMLVNLHLKKDEEYIEKMKKQTDKQMKDILYRMSLKIVDDSISHYDGKCFDQLDDSLRTAKNIAEQNYMNQLSSKDRKDNEYIEMREKQFHILYSMYKRITTMSGSPTTAMHVSKILEKMSKTYHQDNSGEELLLDVQALSDALKQSHLPTTREEFEQRAILYTMMKEMEEFILVKVEFSKKRN